MRILYLGTPEFACPGLEALVRAGHQVVGVVTRPDKPKGRGRKLVPPPLKVVAESYEIPVFQPVKVNASDAVDTLRALAPDILVVAAFGAILRPRLLTLARYGAINVHASLLPAYRGVAPVPWALIHGERVTGPSIMQLDEGVDTGPVFRRQIMEIGPTETAGDLLIRVAQTGAELLIEVLDGIGLEEVEAVPQPDEGASYAPRLEKVHGFLDLSRSAREVFSQFRGTTPAPGARVFLNGEPVLVSALRPVEEASGKPYEILEVSSRHLRVACGEGAVDLLQVRPAGKNDMEGAAFARGRRLAAGSTLSLPAELPDLGIRAIVNQ